MVELLEPLKQVRKNISLDQHLNYLFQKLVF